MPSSLRFSLRAFLRRRRGATAVEFSLIIGPFLALILGVIEVSIAHMNNSQLQTATQQIVRLVETGSGRCMQKEEVVERFCKILEVDRTKCESGVRLSVMSLADMLDSDDMTFAEASNHYEPGVGGDRMGVRAFRTTKSFFPYLGAILGSDTSQNSQTMVMQAAYIFKNEPFNSNTPCESAPPPA